MAGGTFDSDDDDGIVGINVTPLVDVTLVLLIIFMVTATYIVRQTIQVDLPEAAHAGETVQTTLTLTLDKDGKLYLNGQPSDDADMKRTIPGLLAQAKAKGDKLQAIISADKRVTHGAVVHVIDVAKGLGVSRFAINIQKETVDPSDAAAAGGG